MSELAGNVVGLVGLVLVVVAVGLLAGAAWAVLLAGLLMVGVAYVAHTHAERAAAPAARPRLVRERGAA